MRKVFVSAIGTDSGKTVCSAILTEAFYADYWKPVQCGYPRDCESVELLISNSQTLVHPESQLLLVPESPHAAARKEGRTIDLQEIQVPNTNNHLIIEGAGGLMVPINDNDLMADMVKQWDIPIVLVSNHYLGSINHTLLSIEVIKRRGLKILGIVFNGKENPESEQVILRNSEVPLLFRINKEKQINRKVISAYAEIARERLGKYFK